MTGVDGDFLANRKVLNYQFQFDQLGLCSNRNFQYRVTDDGMMMIPIGIVVGLPR